MKRRKLTDHLAANGCVPKREGAKHTIFVNAANGKQSSVPRHVEVKNFIARKICRDLGIPEVLV
jgi:hypothetical protein